MLVAPTLLVNEATCLKMPECLKADIWQTLQLPASSTRVQKITEAIAGIHLQRHAAVFPQTKTDFAANMDYFGSYNPRMVSRDFQI